MNKNTNIRCLTFTGKIKDGYFTGEVNTDGVDCTFYNHVPLRNFLSAMYLTNDTPRFQMEYVYDSEVAVLAIARTGKIPGEPQGFKVGDWCFCEFTLQQIKEMEDDDITRVSDGTCSHSGNSLNHECFPLTMDNKNISGCFETYMQKIRDLPLRHINMPDIYSQMVILWSSACRYMEESGAPEREKWENIDKTILIFWNDIEQKAKDAMGVKLKCGIPLLSE
jgi:hypothetical protein